MLAERARSASTHSGSPILEWFGYLGLEHSVLSAVQCSGSVRAFSAQCCCGDGGGGTDGGSGNGGDESGRNGCDEGGGTEGGNGDGGDGRGGVGGGDGGGGEGGGGDGGGGDGGGRTVLVLYGAR